MSIFELAFSYYRRVIDSKGGGGGDYKSYIVVKDTSFKVSHSFNDYIWSLVQTAQIVCRLRQSLCQIMQFWLLKMCHVVNKRHVRLHVSIWPSTHCLRWAQTNNGQQTACFALSCHQKSPKKKENLTVDTNLDCMKRKVWTVKEN